MVAVVEPVPVVTVPVPPVLLAAPVLVPPVVPVTVMVPPPLLVLLLFVGKVARYGN